MSRAVVQIRKLGQQPYEPVWRAMSEFTTQRGPNSLDEIWFLQHPPIFTLGQAGKREHLLAPGDIPVLACDRGGQVTYHGPGQIVAYPLLDLRRLRMGVRRYVELVEQCMIDALAELGVAAVRRQGAPGVYVDDAKIGALGVRVRHGCTFHGLALNVNMNLEPFQRINPCGFSNLQVTQVVDCGATTSLSGVEDLLIRAFGRQLGLDLRLTTDSPGILPQLATQACQPA